MPQTHNVNLPITVTGRHVSVTEAMRDHAHKKIEGLHLDYPRIIEARFILDVQKEPHTAEIILFCANHIHIEAKTETDNMYASIDETIHKIARRMRKYKTRLLKSHRPRPNDDIHHLEEHVFTAPDPDQEHHDETKDPEPLIIHKENYRIRPLFTDDAIVDLELSEKDFLVYKNARNGKLSIVFRRPDGDYGVIEPEA